MPSFSVITQQPVTRQLVQERTLERAFHDSLFPRILFRGEASPVSWPTNVGDSMVFSSEGLLPPSVAPSPPGVDPIPVTPTAEQWEITLQQWLGTIDTHTPSAMNAIANFFYRNLQQLGLMAAQSMNRAVRDFLYNAALSGHTLCDGAQVALTSIRVLRLNGFTRARRPDLVGGSPVRFDTVSSTNPLAIVIDGFARNVIGFTPDTVGDETGPGVLLLNAATTVTDRSACDSNDSTFLVRAGGGATIDALISTNVLTLSTVRSAIANMQGNNVPEMADGRFHLHLSPNQLAQIFGDPEWQRVNTALPDYYMYRQFAVGEFLGTVFYRNTECPSQSTVGAPGTTTSFPTPFNPSDPFAGELVNATGVKVERALLLGQDCVYEYWQDQGVYVTDAGVTGKIAQPQISNNSIEVFVDRIQIILAAPIDRMQDFVRASWRFVGAYPVRTDATTGSASRFKRVTCIETGS